MSEKGPGCVKTCASGEVAELFSSFPSLGDLCQICSSPIHRNREKASMHESDAGVFTQPGSNSEVELAEVDFRFTLESSHPAVGL